MSKLNNLFNEAKKNKKKLFIGFVTSGDPDYKSSKEIIKEMTKSCQIIEAGISFNTSTSDSPIIMEANDRAINSGMNMKKTFKLIKEVKISIKKKNEISTKFIFIFIYFIHICSKIILTYKLPNNKNLQKGKKIINLYKKIAR